MPRPKKESTKGKDEINRDHYKKMLKDKRYSVYLEEKKQQKQLKLTLSVEMDSAIRQYCSTQDKLTPQEYILSLIKKDLQDKGVFLANKAAVSEDNV